MFVPNSKYNILTPDGFRSFVGLHVIVQPTIRIFHDDVCLLEGSAKHRVLTPTGYTILQDLVVGDVVCAKTSLITITQILSGVDQPLFDPIDVAHPDQAFFTNNIISHNCSFMGSANTLIPASKLVGLSYKEPIDVKGDLKIYAKPVRTTDQGDAHIYVITVDIGQGQGLDYSVINVTDISLNPFVQVAVWRNNKITPTLMAPMIRDIGEYYNNAYVLIEINMEGHAVADMLFNDLEYPSVITIQPHPKKGQILSGGFGNNQRFGLKVTQATKRIGCSGLKTLIEKDKYVITDYQTLRELTTYVVHNSSYQAEVGNFDDCVATLVLMGWLTLQAGFENYVGLSMRKLLMEKHEPVTFELGAIGILGDLEQQSVIGKTTGGHDIIDDQEFWRNNGSVPDPDTSWL